MKLRKSVGHYEPEERPVSVELARNDFFDAIAKLYPIVLEHLGAQPFQDFVRATPKSWKLPYYYHDFLRLYSRPFQSLFEEGTLKPDALALRESILKWTSRYNLSDDWCRERALLTLLYWRDNPSARERLEWKYVFPHRFPVLSLQDEKRLSQKFWNSSDGSVFGYEHWEPSGWHQNRTWYRQALKKHFENRLNAYLDEIESLAKARGFTEQQSSKFPPRYFAMLVYYQVMSKNPEKVAGSASGNKNVVFTGLTDSQKKYLSPTKRETEASFYKAIERLTDFIGLKLRGRISFPKNS